MTPEERFRRFRDAENWHPLQPNADAIAAASTAAPRELRRIALVTAVVVVAVIAASVIAIQLRPLAALPAGGGIATPTASPTASPTAAPGTVAALAHVDGTLLATWTSADATLPPGPFDADGKGIAIVSDCTGGGRLSISISHHSEGSVGCDGGGGGGGPQEYYRNGRTLVETKPITVRISTTGSPTFAVQLWAVPITDEPKSEAGAVAATGPDVPASLRTCAAADFAAKADYARIRDYQGGVITVTSIASTDCAIRSAPVLTYRAADGRQIGAVASVGGGPTDVVGDAGTNGPAPAVRLTAGGRVYFVATLFLARTFAHAPTCEPVVVHELDFSLAAGGTIRVPIPASPASANCRNLHDEANGVSPVVERLISG